jgi:hypothetical protein
LNTVSHPDLVATQVFDSALQKFSEDFIANKISSCHFAPLIDSEDTLSIVMTAIKAEVIDKLFLHEYFMINVAEQVKDLENYLKDPAKVNPQSDLNKGLRDLIQAKLSFRVSEIDLMLRTMRNHGERRYGVTLDLPFAVCLLVDEGQKKPKSQILKEFAWLLT